MKTSKLFFDLPPHLIAQYPHEQRERARLMVLKDEHALCTTVESLIHFLKRKTVIVINTSKVRKARIFARHAKTNKKVEFLLLEQETEQTWSVISRKTKSGESYVLEGGMSALYSEGKLHCDLPLTESYIEEHGNIPLPPYIRRKTETADDTRYQTIYADILGSAAAPTAGLHITDSLLTQCTMKEITIAPIILHTGLGTFTPIKTANIDKHPMHTEKYSISEQTARIINRAKENKNQILAIGTTSLRCIESATDSQGNITPGKADTRLFITPGYTCKTITSLFTNFHTPFSTLLVLIASLIGYDQMIGHYKNAVRRGFRFFSYGDAMLIDSFMR